MGSSSNRSPVIGRALLALTCRMRGSDILGLAGFMPETGLKRAHKGHLWGMYVRAEARGSGLSRRLVEADPAALPTLRETLQPVEDELWAEADDVLEDPARWAEVGGTWGGRALHALRSCIPSST